MFDDGSGDGPMTSKEPAGARCHPRRSRPSLYSSSSRIPSQPSETKAKTSASHGTRRSLPKPCGMLVDAARQPRFAVMLSWSVVFLSVCLSVYVSVGRFLPLQMAAAATWLAAAWLMWPNCGCMQWLTHDFIMEGIQQGPQASAASPLPTS